MRSPAGFELIHPGLIHPRRPKMEREKMGQPKGELIGNPTLHGEIPPPARILIDQGVEAPSEWGSARFHERRCYGMFTLGNDVRRLGTALLDFVYPLHCQGCEGPLETSEEDLCMGCWKEILTAARGPGAHCGRCGCPLEVPDAACAHCAGWEPEFERALILGPFQGALQRAVYATKFKQQKRLGRELGRRMGQAPVLIQELRQVDLLVPVPLHPARQRERGYNQSLCIAQGLGEVLDRPVRDGLLLRRLNTRQQAKLDAEARRQNLSGAFEVIDELPPHECIGIVDDVITSGSTLNECARALNLAGARRIRAIALASPPVAQGNGQGGRPLS